MDRIKIIDHALLDCLKRKYIEEKEGVLTVTTVGRGLLRPLGHFEEYLKRHGRTRNISVSILVAMLSGAVGSFIIPIILNKLIAVLHQ